MPAFRRLVAIGVEWSHNPGRSVNLKTELIMRQCLFALLAALILVPSLASSQALEIAVERDLIYGRVEGAALLADIGYPDGQNGLPAIIYVHGGRWRAGSRTGRNALDVEQWAGFGYFAMTIDYRLVGGSPAPAPYLDLLCAIRWVHAHADEYGIDSDNVYLIGNSAGGHLVALAATLGEGSFGRVGGWSDARSDIRGVVSAAGPYELNTLSWGDLWTPIGGDVHPARRLASPIHQISENTKPILIIHSDDDQSVPIQQAVQMADALKTWNVRHEFVHYVDRGHMAITDEVITETRDFIKAIGGT